MVGRMGRKKGLERVIGKGWPPKTPNGVDRGSPHMRAWRAVFKFARCKLDFVHPTCVWALRPLFPFILGVIRLPHVRVGVTVVNYHPVNISRLLQVREGVTRNADFSVFGKICAWVRGLLT